MLTEFGGASLWSEDINNLLPFYRDVLGLKVLMEEGPYAMLGADSFEKPALLLGTHSEVHGRNNDPARHMISFSSTDIQADWKRLKAAGVEFVQDPTSDGQMWLATLKDPEGNLVQLFQGSPQ
jgi:predicted enzyme related to lactoylglutathione lyase